MSKSPLRSAAAVPLAVILADNKDGLIEGIFFESALEVFKFGLAFGF